jgi:hypothetical protein
MHFFLCDLELGNFNFCGFLMPFLPLSRFQRIRNIIILINCFNILIYDLRMNPVYAFVKVHLFVFSYLRYAGPICAILTLNVLEFGLYQVFGLFLLLLKLFKLVVYRVETYVYVFAYIGRSVLRALG